MTTRPDHVLLLAGTTEARRLAGDIAARFPDARLTASFAGAVSDLPDLGIPTRIGGFGGADGLSGYLARENIRAVIDATHPFAAVISRNACLAAIAEKIPLIRLERPEWSPSDGDNWQMVASLEEAADALPGGACAFLAIGRKEIGVFTHRQDIAALARMIEPPEIPLPQAWHLLLARPDTSVEAEVELFAHHGITHLVTKNSGGTRARAKLDAARALGLPVLMVRRPVLPPARTAASVAEVLEGLRQILG